MQDISTICGAMRRPVPLMNKPRIEEKPAAVDCVVMDCTETKTIESQGVYANLMLEVVECVYVCGVHKEVGFVPIL